MIDITDTSDEFNCKIHNECCDYYCKDEDVPFCRDCRPKHSSHQGVLIADAADDFRRLLDRLVGERFDGRERDIKQMRALLGLERSKIAKGRENASKVVRDAKCETIRAFVAAMNAREKKLLIMVEACANTQLALLSEYEELVNSMAKAMKETRVLMKNAANEPGNRILFSKSEIMARIEAASMHLHPHVSGTISVEMSSESLIKAIESLGKVTIRD